MVHSRRDHHRGAWPERRGERGVDGGAHQRKSSTPSCSSPLLLTWEQGAADAVQSGVTLQTIERVKDPVGLRTYPRSAVANAARNLRRDRRFDDERRAPSDPPVDTSRKIEDILDRLGLLREGILTQAAQVLYGTRFLPDYPQCLLKLGRFRGSTITGDILDNRQEHMHAFATVREAVAWLDRTLPLSARFPPGKLFREDRLPVPPGALREILLNAVMHRDYADPAGHVAIAVFDDRIEVRSVGRLPKGITPQDLSGPHLSIPRNPLIAEAFRRTGAVEIWGRGTNRVIAECKAYGIPPPTFEEIGNAVVVTFQASIGPGAELGHQVGTKSGLSRHQVLVLEAAGDPQPIQELMRRCDRSDRTKFRNQVLRPPLEAGLLAMTVPDRPRSSKQAYRTTEAGRKVLQG